MRKKWLMRVDRGLREPSSGSVTKRVLVSSLPMMAVTISLFISLVSDLRVSVAYLKVRPSSSRLSPAVTAVLRLLMLPDLMVLLCLEVLVAAAAEVVVMVAVMVATVVAEVVVVDMVVVIVATAAVATVEEVGMVEAAATVEVAVTAAEVVEEAAVVSSVESLDTLLGTVARVEAAKVAGDIPGEVAEAAEAAATSVEKTVILPVNAQVVVVDHSLKPLYAFIF